MTTDSSDANKRIEEIPDGPITLTQATKLADAVRFKIKAELQEKSIEEIVDDYYALGDVPTDPELLSFYIGRLVKRVEELDKFALEKRIAALEKTVEQQQDYIRNLNYAMDILKRRLDSIVSIGSIGG